MRKSVRNVLFAVMAIVLTIDFIPSSGIEEVRMQGIKYQECAAAKGVAKGLLKGCKSCRRVIKSPKPPLTKPATTIPRLEPSILNHISNKIKVKEKLKIETTQYGFKIGEQEVSSKDELIKEMSRRIKNVYGDNPLETKLKIEVHCTEEGFHTSIMDDIGRCLRESEPNLSYYDFANAIPLKYSEYTEYVIPCKARGLYAGMAHLKDCTLKLKVTNIYNEKVKPILDKLFKQGGVLTRNRLNKALSDANIPLDAVILQGETFVFAELIIPTNYYPKKQKNDETKLFA